MTTREWTLADLGARVERALAHDYPGQENGQVRAIPDARTIRYYTTLGLIDRPSAFRGRTALYSRRHLAQIVAIKRRQAAGDSLRAIADALAGLDDDALFALARLPEDVTRPVAAASDAPAVDDALDDDRRARAFWLDDGIAPEDALFLDEEDDLGAAEIAAPSAAFTPTTPLVGVAGSRVTFLFAADRPLATEDLAAVQREIARVEALLSSMGIISSSTTNEGEEP